MQTPACVRTFEQISLMVTCIALLSDFGIRDTNIAAVKGMLMQHTSAPVIDISHEATPFLNSQAAYLLRCASRGFPKGTVHLVLCDVFAHSNTQLILSESDDHYFLAANNGIVEQALDKQPLSGQYSAHHTFTTFANWLRGACDVISRLEDSVPSALGLPTFQSPQNPGTNHEQDVIACEVIHIDHYENVVLNVTSSQFETARNGRNFRLQFVMEEIEELSSGYHDVREGYKLCRFNSSDHLEICINRGKAASLFGLRLGTNQNNIKILFE